MEAEVKCLKSVVENWKVEVFRIEQIADNGSLMGFWAHLCIKYMVTVTGKLFEGIQT